MVDDSPAGEAHEAEHALRQLEDRLSRASEAAERLISEAAAGAKPPPAGWQAPNADDGSPRQPFDTELLAQVLQSLRELIPPELQQRLAEALREVLLALRALIDWYVERIESARGEPADVEDIPIL